MVRSPSMISTTMNYSTRDVADFIPPEEVPAWVHSDQVAVYLDVILTTMVVYDAGTVLLSHHSHPG